MPPRVASPYDEEEVEISGSDDEQPRCETSVLRGLHDGNVPPPLDKWFELANVMVRGNENVLLRNPKSLHVNGKLRVEQKAKDMLRFVKDASVIRQLQSTGVHVKLSQVVQVSVAYDPITLWVETTAGAFEVKPSEVYKPVYERIHHAIALSFSAQEYYESAIEYPFEESQNPIMDLVFHYIMHEDGSGVTVEFLFDVLKKSRDWILKELDGYTERNPHKLPHELVIFQRTPFYIWLKAGAKVRNIKRIDEEPIIEPVVPPGIAQNLWNPTKRAIDEGRILPPQRPVVKPLLGNQNPIKILGDQDPLHKGPSTSLSPSLNTTPQVTDVPTPSAYRPYHGQYLSTQFPAGPQGSSNTTAYNVELIAALICHAVDSGRRSLASMTREAVGDMFYKDYSIQERKAAYALVLTYGPRIRALLPADPSWRASTLYKTLASTDTSPAFTAPVHASAAVRTQIQDARVALPRYLSGEKLIKHRVQAKPKKEPNPNPVATAAAVVGSAGGDSGSGAETSSLRGHGSGPGPADGPRASTAAKRLNVKLLSKPSQKQLQDHERHRDPAIISGRTPSASPRASPESKAEDDEEEEDAVMEDAKRGKDGKVLPKPIKRLGVFDSF